MPHDDEGRELGEELRAWIGALAAFQAYVCLDSYCLLASDGKLASHGVRLTLCCNLLVWAGVTTHAPTWATARNNHHAFTSGKNSLTSSPYLASSPYQAA